MDKLQGIPKWLGEALAVIIQNPASTGQRMVQTVDIITVLETWGSLSFSYYFTK
jgi:hypothetical protein